MGGKTATTTQQVQIPPEVMARYNAVNKRAENVAQKPFQQYGGEFVAPITEQQQAGFENINQAANQAQPYFNAASGMTLYGSQGVGPLTGGQINQYMSPYLSNVASTTLGNLSQEQAMQRQQQLGQGIKAGAMGGDRLGLERANLARQQAMAYGTTASNIYNQGYGQAVQTAVGQQGVRAQDLARLQAGGAQIGALGTAAQQAALQGAQAQVGAGTLQQQTQQALDTAKYQQFLQERGYDFQVAQFLANIAMGTGALSGSTTTTTQPQSFFSDERLKENIEPVGELNDGQPIYRYNYKGDPRTQIGLIAQDVEKSHPEAVGLAGGYRTVDYGKATDEAAGVMPESMGGAVLHPGAYAAGGMVDPNDLQALIASQAQSFGPFSQAGLYGAKGGGVGASGYVPSSTLPVGRLMTAGSAPTPPKSGLQQAIGGLEAAGDLGGKMAKAFDVGKRGLFGSAATEGTAQKPGQAPTRGLAGVGGEYDKSAGYLSGIGAGEPADISDISELSLRARGGGVMPHYASGGSVNPYEMNADPLQDVLEEQDKKAPELQKPGQMPGAPPGGAGADIMGGLKAAGSAASAASALMSLFAMSDERLKHNVEPIGKLFDGQEVYRYDFGDGRTQMGLMAQDVERSNPQAVGEIGGYKAVNYNDATEDAAGLGAGRRAFANGGSADDEDLAIRTIAAEMGGKSPEEARAIAAVIENRRKSGRYGDTYADVVKARGQFEPWSRPEAPNYPMRFTPDSPRYRMASEAFAQRADDPTGGAQNFYAPAAQKALGRPEPAWASGREGKDIGATRFFNLGEKGVMPRPKADIAPREPASEAPRRGLSAPAEFGTNKPQEWGDFLTSRQFVVPLLTGLGAMASSPSRYLGSAVLQGLGAGAQAYGDQEKLQADIEKTRAATGLEKERAGLTSVQASRARFLELPSGRAVVLVPDPKTGGTTSIPIEDAYARMEKGELILSPEDTNRVKEYVKKNPVPEKAGAPAGSVERKELSAPAPAPAAAAPKKEEAAPATPETTAAPAKPAADVTGLSEDDVKKAQEWKTAARGQGSKFYESHPDIYTPQQERAEGAQAARTQILPMAAALSGAPKTGILAPGAMQSVLRPVADYVNSIATSIGFKEPPINSDDLARSEEAQKYLARMRETAIQKNDLRAVSALDAVARGYPSDLNTTKGLAKLLSGVQSESQRDIDKNEYFKKFKDVAERDALGQIAPQRSGSWADLNARFNESRAPIISAEKQKLERMYLETPIIGRSPQGDPLYLGQDGKPISKSDYQAGKGRPVSWAEYIIKNGDKLTPQDKSAIEKQFGKGILRYYGI